MIFSIWACVSRFGVCFFRFGYAFLDLGYAFLNLGCAFLNLKHVFLDYGYDFLDLRNVFLDLGHVFLDCGMIPVLICIQFCVGIMCIPSISNYCRLMFWLINWFYLLLALLDTFTSFLPIEFTEQEHYRKKKAKDSAFLNPSY